MSIDTAAEAPWKKLRYHADQSNAWRSTSKRIALACGRGSGKTELARRYIIRHLPIKKPWRNPLYFYALPTFSQAKRVAWHELKNLIPREWIAETLESELKITTVFGSTLYVVGLDKPERCEGVQWDGCVIDEASDQRPGTFDRSILPALSHRDAWCWRIGVPKRYGIGAREYKEFFDHPDTESYTWPSSDILTEKQIETFKRTMSKEDYNEQFNAQWLSGGGLIFSSFHTKHNVTSTIEFDPTKDIVIGSDFNVDPMSWVLGHFTEDGLDIFDEIYLRNTNTEKTLQYLHARYGKYEVPFHFFGDAAASQRRSSANKSDYIQVLDYARSRDSSAKLYYPKRNPGLIDRFAACNALFKSASGDIRFRVHPRCKNLISDLSNRAYKEGTNDVMDGPFDGHMSDALGYIIHKKWPLRIFDRSSQAAVFSFSGR